MGAIKGLKVPTLTVVAAIAAFVVANADVGSFVFDNATGIVYVVRITAGVKSLVAIDGSTGLGEWASRALSLTATPGAPASGEVDYRAEVINADANPVPGALVWVGTGRAVGAGAGSITVTTGTRISQLDTAGSNIATLVQCDNLGVAEWTLTGTAGDTWSTTAATDAPTGGQSDADAGRVLP